ncbi:MAG: aminotransferase class I/II-fold pyridoxal phosphate-dependent enzyme [Planctomycetes bacterium]|nr:aminotransferase class I/II-fold pyridoxal phosphate-dependent enzyme [Planctomycetota bacterium]
MSGIRKIFELAQGVKDAVDFSLGQPHFDTPAEVKAAAIQAIQNGFNRYTVTQGIPALREKIRSELARKWGFRDGDVMVTAGVAGGLFLATAALVDKGDEVIVPDPYFVLYRQLVNFFLGVPVLLDTYPDFRIRPEKLEALITPRTKLILFNNPVNPTGTAYTAAEVAAIAAVARKHGVLLASDEIYEAFSYDFPHESMLRHDPGALLMGGFGKTYAIPGWRLGFAAGPREIIEKMNLLQQFSFVCAPSPAQAAGVAALSLDMKPYIDEYRRKRDFVYEGLRDRYEVVKPQGAFYIFPKCPSGDDQTFVRRAIENKVLIVPGGACSQHQTHFRLSFAASDPDLARGVEILNRLALDS